MIFAITQDEKQAGTSWCLASPEPPHLQLSQEELGDVPMRSTPKTLTNSVCLQQASAQMIGSIAKEIVEPLSRSAKGPWLAA